MTLPVLKDSTLELTGRVALLTLQRDDVRNALTGTDLLNDIETAVTWAERLNEVSVLVITGGGSAFSSGGNVKEMRERKGIFGGTAWRYRSSTEREFNVFHCSCTRRKSP